MDVPCLCKDCSEFKTKVRQQIWAFHLFGSIDPGVLVQNLTDLVGVEGQHKIPVTDPKTECQTTTVNNIPTGDVKLDPDQNSKRRRGRRSKSDFKRKNSASKRKKGTTQMSASLIIKKAKEQHLTKDKLNWKTKKQKVLLQLSSTALMESQYTENPSIIPSPCNSSNSNQSAHQKIDLNETNQKSPKKSKNNIKIRILGKQLPPPPSQSKKVESKSKRRVVTLKVVKKEEVDQGDLPVVRGGGRKLRRKRRCNRRAVDPDYGKPPKRFVGDRKAWLKIHSKIRKVSLANGTTQFDCTICNSSFNQHTFVARHIRIVHFHQRKPCAKCGRGFYDGRNLRNHLFLCTGKAPPPDLTAGKEKVERQRRHRPRTQITSTTAFRERFKRGI